VSEQSEQLNIWEVLHVLRSQWRWPIVGALCGALIGFLIYLVLPPKFEATVVISPARVGSLVISATGNSLVQGSEPESAALMIERFKQPSFYSATIRERCHVRDEPSYQMGMAKDLNANIVKLPNPTLQSLSLAKLSWNADSPTTAHDCLTAIVQVVTEVQNTIAAPVMAKLAAQRKITQDQLNLYMSDLAKLEAKNGNNKEGLANNFNQIVIADKSAQNLRESLTAIRKQLGEEEAQLSEPYTQPVKQLEAIYAAPEPVITAKLAILIGVLAGLFLGGFALLLKLSMGRYQSESSDRVSSKRTFN
jgi:LPS O-antigen subunit length determinant protein (WzzB/FepE family)